MFKNKCLNARLAITSKQFRGDLGEGVGGGGERGRVCSFESSISDCHSVFITNFILLHFGIIFIRTQIKKNRPHLLTLIH